MQVTVCDRCRTVITPEDKFRGETTMEVNNGTSISSKKVHVFIDVSYPRHEDIDMRLPTNRPDLCPNCRVELAREVLDTWEQRWKRTNGS